MKSRPTIRFPACSVPSLICAACWPDFAANSTVMLLRLLWSVVTATVLSGANIDFAREVAPILRQHCAACHAGKVKTSGFTVDSMESVIQGGNKHGKAVIGGHPEKSPLLQLIKGDIAPRMPAGLDTLAKADVDRIEAW